MTTVVTALLYALFVWWFATGLALLIVLRSRRGMCVAGITLACPLALYGMALASERTGIAGAYLAFSLAILLWGTQEVAFLTGACTGPRPLPCRPGARGMARFRAAVAAILYHEIALLACGIAVLAVTWHAPNQVGALTFLVLWVMRISAKLNLFFGVPVLNDEVLPGHLAFLRSYFRQAPANAFYPVSVVLSVLGLSWLVTAAADTDVSMPTSVGLTLVATLMALAIVEHMFMLVPLPIGRLWAWAGGKMMRAPRDAAKGPRDGMSDKMDRATVTSS